MANVVLKSLKFSQTLNARLSFSTLKPYYGRYFIRSYSGIKQTKAYATTAYKVEPNEDFSVKNSVASSNVVTKDIRFIDDSLSKIDSLVGRNGRVQMKIVHNAFSSVTSKDMTSNIHALYLIRSCKYCSDEPPSKRIELVNQIWNRYQELGIEFDVRHYNSLLDVHISNGFNFNPAEILASMEDVNVQPNKTTYLLLIKKYCQDGDIAGASEILEHMKKEGISADEKVFNYLIEGHVKNNDLTGAKDIIQVMRSSGLQPNDDTYGALACGYAATGEKNEMIACLKECKSELTIQPYLKVIDVLTTSGNHDHIDEVLSLIQNKRNYREEFINAAVELIHKNEFDVAFKLACAAHTPINNESMNIFIKQLIRGQKPVSTILHFSDRIFNENLQQNIYLIAQKFASECGFIDCTVSLSKKMIENGYYVRASNFWPLFAFLKEKNSKDVWPVLSAMVDLSVPADFTTYLENVYPILGVPKPEDVINNVRASGQSVETAADALLVYYCHLGEIDYAADLIEIFPASIGSRLDIELFLSNSFNLKKESMNKFLKILKHMFKEVDNPIQCAVQGKLLAELVLRRVNVLETLLKKYEDLHFTPKTLNVCEREVSLRDPAKEVFVKKMKMISSERDSIFRKEHISIKDENRCLKHLQAENISPGPFLVKRVNYHIKNKNLARISELLPLFEKFNLTYSPVMLANLMSLHCTSGDIEKVTEFANKLKTDYPDFRLDLAKLLDYVCTLMRYEKFEESINALNYYLKEQRYNYTNKDMVLRNVRRLRISLSAVRDIEFIKNIQKLLLDHLPEEIGSKELLLEPLLHHHLSRDDLTSAFDEFKNIVVKYHVPFGLNALLKKCISLEDKNTLQKVIDLAGSHSRKSFVLLELAVAFIETFNIQKAVQIIEKLDREISHKDLEDMCLKLCQLNKFAELENLLYITKSLVHVDREKLYMYVLKACANKKDHRRAKKLYAVLKQEIPELKSETINYAERILPTSSQPSHEKVVTGVSSENIISEQALEATKSFIENLEAGNITAALRELEALKKGYIRTLSLKTITDLIDLCLQKNCTTDLSMNVNAMSYIIENAKHVLRPLLEKYSEEGDVDKFVAISNFMPDFSVMNIGYNTFVCKAYIKSGKFEELLSELEQRINKKNKLFCSLAFQELLNLPQYEDRIFNLAVKYFDVNYTIPMAVVWAHYFLKHNFEKADEIFKKYPFQVDKIDVVVTQIKESENLTAALKYVDFVKPLAVRSRVKERAFGTALTLLVSQGMYDEAVNLVVEAEKQNLSLHKYYMIPLMTLKDAFEKENKPVPFSIPMDPASDSSSDSE